MQGALWDSLSTGKLHTLWKLPLAEGTSAQPPGQVMVHAPVVRGPAAGAGSEVTQIPESDLIDGAKCRMWAPPPNLDLQRSYDCLQLADVVRPEPATVWSHYEGCIPESDRHRYPFLLWDAWACLETLKEVARWVWDSILFPWLQMQTCAIQITLYWLCWESPSRHVTA